MFCRLVGVARLDVAVGVGRGGFFQWVDGAPADGYRSPRRDGAVGMAVAVQSEMATPPIFRFGTDEQKARYLGPAIRGEKVACLGITEPNAGSDVASIETVAVRDGDDWVLSADAERARLRNVRGLEYLARLLAAPRTEIAASALVSGGVEAPGRRRPHRSRGSW